MSGDTPQSFFIALSEPFQAMLQERYGHDPELLSQKEFSARFLLQHMLRGKTRRLTDYNDTINEGLLDMNAALIICGANDVDKGLAIPFINAFYLSHDIDEVGKRTVMQHFAQADNPAAFGHERITNPLYTLYAKRDLRKEWEGIINQPNMNPNRPVTNSSNPYNIERMEYSGPIHDGSLSWGKNFLHLDKANILEFLCAEQASANKKAKAQYRADGPWRQKRIKELLDAGCIITDRAREDIEVCEDKKLLTGISAIIASKRERIDGFVSGSLSFEEMTGQDIKDAYAQRMLAPLFAAAQEDRHVAQALLKACSEAPQWLQDEIRAGVTLLAGKDITWLSRHNVEQTISVGEQRG